MRGQYEELNCPFCDKGRISCLYFPSVWGEKRRGKNALGSGKKITKSSEEWIIKSGCPNCGKSEEDVERKLKSKNII